MIRPSDLQTKIFIDGGDPQETLSVLSVLGSLDGQTTNPTLIAKHPEAQHRLRSGKLFSLEELYDFYRAVVQEISRNLPNGFISIEVAADQQTTAYQMIEQAHRMNTWIRHAHIKLPCTAEGITAASALVEEGINVNMTLCFSQHQAAAVYAATRRAQPGQILLSPFIGRMDDSGWDGLSLVENILQMFKSGDGHVQVLAASIRSFEHMTHTLALKPQIITAPAKVLLHWAKREYLASPPKMAEVPQRPLRVLPYFPLELQAEWTSFDLHHSLTDAGLDRFAQDWNALIKVTA